MMDIDQPRSSKPRAGRREWEIPLTESNSLNPFEHTHFEIGAAEPSPPLLVPVATPKITNAIMPTAATESSAYLSRFFLRSILVCLAAPETRPFFLFYDWPILNLQKGNFAQVFIPKLTRVANVDRTKTYPANILMSLDPSGFGEHQRASTALLVMSPGLWFLSLFQPPCYHCFSLGLR